MALRRKRKSGTNLLSNTSLAFSEVYLWRETSFRKSPIILKSPLSGCPIYHTLAGLASDVLCGANALHPSTIRRLLRWFPGDRLCTLRCPRTLFNLLGLALSFIHPALAGLAFKSGSQKLSISPMFTIYSHVHRAAQSCSFCISRMCPEHATIVHLRYLLPPDWFPIFLLPHHLPPSEVHV